MYIVNTYLNKNYSFDFNRMQIPKVYEAMGAMLALWIKVHQDHPITVYDPKRSKRKQVFLQNFNLCP